MKDPSIDEAAKEAEAKLLAMISPNRPQVQPGHTPKEEKKTCSMDGSRTCTLSDDVDPFEGLSGDPDGAKPTGDQQLLESLKSFNFRGETSVVDKDKESKEVLAKLGFSPQRSTAKIDFSTISDGHGSVMNEEEAKKELAAIFG